MSNENSVENSLKKGIVLVFVANLINLMISLVNGFVLPKYLSVESFADIKTYQLYAGYIGVLVLGYSDGLYLQYGGKKIVEVGERELSICKSNLLIFQGIISIIALIIAKLLDDDVLLITAISVVPVNIVATYKSVFQATGEFKIYSKLLNYTSILNFTGSMVLLFAFRTDNALLYIAWMVLVTFIAWFIMEYKIHRQYHFKMRFRMDVRHLICNIKMGIILMLGNFSSILMTSIDRWFVKALLSIQDFAYYSFVVSVEHLVSIFITPIVTTMYNYICITNDFRKIRRIKNICLLVALALISSAFPAKLIMELYLKKYMPSKNVLFILFSTEVLFMLIKGIYVNVYKARKRQKQYFLQLTLIILLSCIFNGIAYFIWRTNEAIAVATLLSVICWYVMCSFSVKELMPNWKEVLILVVSIPVYILCGVYLSAIVGGIIYLSTVIILAFMLMRSEALYLVRYAAQIAKAKFLKRARYKF